MFYQPSSGGGLINRLFKFLFSSDPVARLMLINSLVLLAIGFSNLYFYLFNLTPSLPSGLPAIVYWSAMPAEITQLAARPWSVVTSMFVHFQFLHFALNMLMLYFSGVIFSTILKRKHIWVTYLAGGISGAVFFIAAYNFFPVFEDQLPLSYAIGASAAIMAVLFTVVAYAPDYTIRLFLFGQMQLKYLALVFVLIDLLSISADNPGGHIAHLGGAFFGAVYGFLLRRRISFHIKPLFRRKPRMKTKAGGNSRPETDDQYRQRRASDQQKTDAILDKISKGGYESLSREEKEWLFKHRG